MEKMLPIVMGEVIRELRKEKKLKLRDLSASSGIALGYLSEIERGDKDISSRKLYKLLGSLEMPLVNFLLLVAVKMDRIEKETLNK